MSKPAILLAKTPYRRGGHEDSETLVGHTKQVMQAAETLLGELKKATLFTEVQDDWEAFRQLVMLSAIFHDLGKATNIFQDMLVNDKSLRNRIHPLRHEILSALLITSLETPLKNWMAQVSSADAPNFRWMVSWIAGGHHLKLHLDKPFSQKEADRLVRIHGATTEFIFFGDHADILTILDMAAKVMEPEKAGVLPVMKDTLLPVEEDDGLPDGGLQSVVDNYILSSEQNSTKLTCKEMINIALAKAILISADVAGSALTREGLEPNTWIRNALGNDLSASSLQNILDVRLKEQRLRGFQERVMKSTSPVTLTVAGCGNGKTLAAYAWAKQRATGYKLFFCYPTTGTASVGFEDYLLAQTDIERNLIHGRASVDMERLLKTNETDWLEDSQRLESLKAWSQQVVACTADTVLGLLQNHRFGLFSFPAFLKAAFVFDEIHNYDSKLFGALLKFLEIFRHAPILLMSASIPSDRMIALRKVIGDRLSDPIGGDPDLEEIARYVPRWRSEPSDCWYDVQEALNANQKVLWVCNTVNDAGSLFQTACEKTKSLGISPIIYHSRFRYKDRVERQATVIERFRHSEPSLVIATQVCEMSLNISTDLMVSALAPFPSLVQRLGRLNRYSARVHGKPDPPPKDCLIYDFDCQEGRPYKKTDLAVSRKILNDLWENPCSQALLAQCLADLQQEEETKDWSAWLDGKWQSDQRPLRDGENSISVIMEEDLSQIKAHLKESGLRPNSQNVAAWTIPMLYKHGMNFEKRLGGYPVANAGSIDYDEFIGARWARQTFQIL